jgi:septal ring factor EnvC (AmiA/AmiB activator)
MEVDFVNAYINRQKQYIEDLTNKLILAEAKIVTLEKTINDLSNKIVDYESRTVKPSENSRTKS